MTQGQIAEAQLRLHSHRWHPPMSGQPRSERSEIRRVARWWEMEAMRGYPSSDKSREYAANQRWLVELLDNGVRIKGRRFDELLREQKRRRAP